MISIPAREVYPDIHIGDIVDARVTQVREDGKLTLSARKKAYIQMDEDAARIMEVIDAYEGVLPFSDSASPEVIRQKFGMSKNAFKRAIGKLYKEHRVVIEENSVRRI